MAKCQICSKTSIIGRNVSHSEVKTSRQFKANLQKITFFLDGKKKTMTLCAKCIKRLKKDGRLTKIKREKKKK